MSNLMNTNNYNYKKDNWWFLGELPSKNGRYIVLDTETTGFSAQYNNVIELAAVEISKGKLTGVQYHAYIRPRNPIDPRAEEKHKMGNNFYQDFYSDVYHSDKTTMENFLKFVGNSIIFAHNASFDYNFINNELKFWKLPMLPKNRFRCTMRIFKAIFGQVDINFKKYCSLAKCCDYFNLKSNRYNFHTAIFDSFMTARLLCKIYEYVENRNNQENIGVGNGLSTGMKMNINYGMDGEMNSEVSSKNQNVDENIININEKNMVIQIANDVLEVMENQVVLEKNITSNTNNNLNSNSDDNNEEMNDFIPDAENFDLNTLDQDMLIIQECEGFINSYMNDQNKIHQDPNWNINEQKKYELRLKERNFDNNTNIVNNLMIMDPLNHGHFHSPIPSQNQMVMPQNILNEVNTMSGIQGSDSKHSKYKDLMRKYVNTYNKTNDIKNSVEKMKEESREEGFQLSSEDIEEIIKGNI